MVRNKPHCRRVSGLGWMERQRGVIEELLECEVLPVMVLKVGERREGGLSEGWCLWRDRQWPWLVMNECGAAGVGVSRTAASAGKPV